MKSGEGRQKRQIQSFVATLHLQVSALMVYHVTFILIETIKSNEQNQHKIHVKVQVEAVFRHVWEEIVDNYEEKKEGKKLIVETDVVEYTVSGGFSLF